MLFQLFFKPLKFLLYGLLALILFFIFLLILGVLFVILFINPNHYKAQIEQNFYEQTHRNLNISGDIHWSFFPSIGVSIGSAEILNPSGFSNDFSNKTPSNFASWDKASISLSPWPLVHQVIAINAIKISSLKINLIQTSQTPQNLNNLNNWSFNFKSPEAPANASAVQTSQLSLKSPAPAKKTNTSWPLVFKIGSLIIKNAQVSFQDFSNSSNPLNSANPANPGRAWVFKNINLQAKNLALGQAFPFNFNLDFVSPDKTNIHWDSQAELLINQDDLSLNNLTAYLKTTHDQSMLTGFIKINNFSAPEINLNLMLDQLDLADYFNFHGAVLFLGASTITANLNTKGLTPDQFPSSLNGSIHADIANIVLKGADLREILSVINQSVDSLMHASGIKSLLSSLGILKETIPGVDPSKSTQLGNLTYQSEVNQGVVQNKLLVLSSPDFKIKGQGTINLNSEQVSYQLSAFSLNKNGERSGLIIPIMIQGPFSNIQTKVDFSNLLNQFQSENQTQSPAAEIKSDLKPDLKPDLKKAGQDLLNNLKNNFQGLVGGE